MLREPKSRCKIIELIYKILMDFIFQIEKLRIDELMKKVSIRKNFTPLKPLKALDSNIRINSLNAYSKKRKKQKKVANTSKNTKYIYDVDTFSLNNSIFLESPKQSINKEMLKFNPNKTSFIVFENCVNPWLDHNITKRKKNCNNETKLEKLESKMPDVSRKRSISLITHLPKVIAAD